MLASGEHLVQGSCHLLSSDGETESEGAQQPALSCAVDPGPLALAVWLSAGYRPKVSDGLCLGATPSPSPAPMTAQRWLSCSALGQSSWAGGALVLGPFQVGFHGELGLLHTSTASSALAGHQAAETEP